MVSDDEKSYEEQLNEKIDAGGCVEAWETMNDIREGDRTSRRGIIKGAATFSVAMLGSGAIASTPSSASTPAPDDNSIVTELDRDEALQSFKHLSKDPKYKLLKSVS